MPDYQAELDAVLNEPEAAAQTAPGGAPDYAKELADVMGAPDAAPAPAPLDPSPKSEVGLLEAIGRGGGQGVTAGFGDELAGMLPGVDTDEQRKANEAAQKAHPIAYGISNAAGSLVPAAGAAAAGLISAPATAMTGLAYLIAQKYGNQEGGAIDRTKAVAKDVVEHPVQNALEVGLNFAGPAVGKLAGKGLDKAGDVLSWLGRKADNVKAGATQATRKAMIEKYGVEGGPDMIGEMLRKHSPSSLFSPKTSAGHLAEVEKKLGAEASTLGALRRKAGDEGADAALPTVWQGAKNDISAAADAAAQQALGAKSRGVGRELLAQKKAVEKLQAPVRLEDLIGLKSALGDEAFEAGLAHSVKDKASGLAAKKSYQAMKNAEELALDAATPETAKAARESSKAYSELAGLEDLLQPRAATDDAVGNIGTSLASAALAGGMHPAGVMSALGSGTNNALRQMTSGVAHDVFSNIMHPSAAAARSTASGVRNASAPLTNMVTSQIEDSNKPENSTLAQTASKGQNNDASKRSWYDSLPPRQRAEAEEKENDAVKDELRELQK